MDFQWVKPALIDFGYVTVFFVLILPVFNTFKKVLSMKSVGEGARVEPFMASLAGYACSLILALFNDNWEYEKWIADESVWVNGVASFIYLVYIGLFLSFADYTVQRTTLRAWAPAAAAYILVTAIVGLLDESMVGVKWLCMIAGVASSGVPLFLVCFLMERSVQNLPDWFSSSVGVVHYTVWISRAFPETDLYDLIQNASGLLCSLAFLYLLFRWRNQNGGQQGEEYEHLLGNHQDHQVKIQVEDLQGAEKKAQDNDNNVLLDANQRVAIEPHLQEARRASSAPATPERAAIHRRPSSAGARL